MKENQQDFKVPGKMGSRRNKKLKKVEERQQAEGYLLPAVFAIV